MSNNKLNAVDNRAIDNKEEVSALSSLAARNKARQTVQADIDAFLAQGGRIQQVGDDIMSDPPKKPTSNYGSRPI